MANWTLRGPSPKPHRETHHEEPRYVPQPRERKHMQILRRVPWRGVSIYSVACSVLGVIALFAQGGGHGTLWLDYIFIALTFPTSACVLFGGYLLAPNYDYSLALNIVLSIIISIVNGVLCGAVISRWRGRTSSHGAKPVRFRGDRSP